VRRAGPAHQIIDPDRAVGVSERDSRAEALLIEGLDQYFSGHYDESVVELMAAD